MWITSLRRSRDALVALVVEVYSSLKASKTSSGKTSMIRNASKTRLDNDGNTEEMSNFKAQIGTKKKATINVKNRFVPLGRIINDRFVALVIAEKKQIVDR